VILARTLRRLLAGVGLALTLGFSGLASAQVAVPPLAGHVTDLTATLTPAQKESLEQTLAAFEARKGSQLAVLLLPTTAPEGIDQYALRVAEQWKIGRAKVDDGAILVVAKDDRTLRLEVGYGLEGALSDIVSKRIISDTIVPRFKQGDYYGGIDAGVAQIIRVVDGEALPAPASQRTQGPDDLRQMFPFLLILVVVVGGVLRNLIGKLAGSVVTGALVGALAWLVMGTVLLALLAGLAAMVVTLLGGGAVLRGLGGIGGSVGGGRGGFGGGGFRGGGGGFGGGGASGRW
jgi:uncharacterized protein